MASKKPKVGDKVVFAAGSRLYTINDLFEAEGIDQAMCSPAVNAADHKPYSVPVAQLEWRSDLGAWLVPA